MQLSNEIIQILEYLGSKIGVTLDWTSENVVPYAEQLVQNFVKWEFSTSLAWIIIALCASIAMFIFAKVVKNLDGFQWVLFVFVAVVSFIIISCQIFDMIECQVFPEKAIYDYIQMYIRG